MIFIDNKYTRWYYSIIQNSKKHPTNGYVELHHIVPKSFYKTVSQTGWLDGNPDEPTNLIKLTAREHFVCHLLLTKMTSGMAYKKSVYAVRRCRHGKPGTPQYVASSRVYKIIKEQWDAINPFKDPIWQKNNSKKLKGKKFTEEHKNNIKKSWTPERREALSKKYKGIKNPNKATNKGKKMPQLAGPNNGFYGKKHTDECRENARKRLQGKIPPWGSKKLLCEHCNRYLDLGNYKRYHGDNCKSKHQ